MVGDKLWFLIPGIGTQGGFIAETVKAAYAGPESIAINSSSEIIFASSGEDYAEAAAQKAKELRDKINANL
jgi:orotidine-5'-phosphate decarboxylase